MKNQKYLSLTLLLSLLLLFGCGSSKKEMDLPNQTGEDPQSQISSLEKEEFLSKNGTNPEAASSVEESLSLEELRKKLTDSIVYIECGNYHGSGVIWNITEEYVEVLTVRHLLVTPGEKADVTFSKGEYYTGEVTYIAPDTDLGIVRLERQTMDEEDISAMTAVSAGKEEIVNGMDLVVFGSREYVASNFEEGYITNTNDTMDFTELGFEGAVIVAKTKDSDILPGMSGSGVFDRSGHLLGILVAGEGGADFAYVQVADLDTKQF